MENCLFCRIVKGEIPSEKVYEDEAVYAFRDIHPQAPTHVLVVSKAHVSDLNEAVSLDDAILASCLRGVSKAAEICGLRSFRMVSNCGADACQSVKHLHFHVLGGTQLTDRMG